MPVSKLLNLPIGSYLMVRLDYVIICGNNELEAKVLRLIEMYMDDERRRLYQAQLNDPKNELTPDVVVEITRDVWVPISHRLFMNDLYGTVKSENTLKQAIKSLKDKKYIRISDPPTKQYEAPKYQINIEVVQGELDKLAKLGKSGYQKLIPSKNDTIKKRYHQKMPPSGDQNLTPSAGSMVSKSDTNSRRDYGNKKDTVEESSAGSGEPDAPTSLSSHSENDSHSHGGYTNPPIDFEAAQERKRPTNPQMPAITQEMLAEKVKMPAVKPQQTPTPQSQAPGQPDVAPPASVGKGTAQVGAGTGKRTQEKQPESVPKCSTKEIQARINAYRGYALEEEVEIIRERKAIKTWCNLHELGDFDIILHYLTTIDPYWKKPENKYRIGGLTLLKETPKALAEIAKRQNGKQENAPDEPELGMSGLPKLHVRRPRYA